MDGRQPLREFLPQFVRTQTRSQLVVISLIVSVSLLSTVAFGLTLSTSWRRFVLAAALVGAQSAFTLFVLSLGRIQRWIRGSDDW